MNSLAVTGTLLMGAALVRAALALLGPIRRELERHRQVLRGDERLRQRIERALDHHREAREREMAWRGVREFVVVRAEREDQPGAEAPPRIRSLYLAPRDGVALPAYTPGQYVTLHLDLPGADRPVIRCYSLSDLPRPDYYRITVKDVAKEHAPAGASRFLVRDVEKGSVLGLEAPRGSFRFTDAGHAPAVFIAGGMGINPLACMLRAATRVGVRRPVHLFYGVRDGSEHLMRAELERLSRDCDLDLHVAYSRPRSCDTLDVHYQHEGRIDVAMLQRHLASPDCDVYLCAPPPMMGELSRALSRWGVAAPRVHTEAWGAASLRRTSHAPEAPAPGQPIEVTFRRSGKVCQWDPKARSLLDFAEEHGVELTSGCRAGNCGACVTATTGDVRYLREPGALPAPGTCLACIAVPAGSVEIDA